MGGQLIAVMQIVDAANPNPICVIKATEAQFLIETVLAFVIRALQSVAGINDEDGMLNILLKVSASELLVRFLKL